MMSSKEEFISGLGLSKTYLAILIQFMLDDL